MTEGEVPFLSVVILTFNGETYLRQILHSLRDQDVDGELEVIVIDSGSVDATLAIVADFPEVRLVQIPNSEFGHGKTRNLGARLARGSFVAFLTHDAIPLNRNWARELIAPFALSEDLVAVLGRQVPRKDCFPLLKYEINDVFQALGNSLGVTVYELKAEERNNEGIVAAKAFYSDVNSAARREFLTEVIPYQDVNYAEDQLFGRDLLLAGFKKAYAPEAAVEHSNDLTLGEYGPRIFDETCALREIGRTSQPLGLPARSRLVVFGVLRDAWRILRDPAYSRRRKLYWLFMNPAYHLRKWSYFNKAAKQDLSDERRNRHSLEERKKGAVR